MANLTFLRTCGECVCLQHINYKHGDKMLLEISVVWSEGRSSSLLSQSVFCLLYAKGKGRPVIYTCIHESFYIQRQNEGNGD